MRLIEPITWQRLRDIFGNPKPVLHVTERQFDGGDQALQQLAQTPYEEFDFGDLWYYYHDLAYVDLQPELFAYLFPVCLMDWHQTLLAHEPCSHGDSEFHYGIIQGRVFERMLTPLQREQTEAVFYDSMLFRLDRERGFLADGMQTSAYGWMSRLNSLGLFSPILPKLWRTWWELATPGRAVAALQYCSGLMYFDGENPLFDSWTPDYGGGGPYLWEHDSYLHDRGWTAANIAFLQSEATPQRVAALVQSAAKRLHAEPEADLAARLASDLQGCAELMESRLAELPQLLAAKSHQGWTV